MRRFLKIWYCCLFFATTLSGQQGFVMLNGAQQAEIPFEYYNNFIILKINFNGFLPLQFIFDTGAEHTILSKREIGDLFKVAYDREFRVMGSDLKTELVAYLARNIRLEIPDKVMAPAEDILVLQEDYFRFDEYVGMEIHGIISGNIFSKYIYKINYDRRVIVLYNREKFKLRDQGFKEMKMEVYRNKPYLNTQIEIMPDTVVPVKLLIDTGASLSMLLFNNTHSLVHPPDRAIPSNIGMGLGGFVQGYTARVNQLHLPPFSQNNIITFFQPLDSAVTGQMVNQRNGLIGNILLSRFQVIFDYQNDKIWFKPGKKYKEAFIYDRSGMQLLAHGKTLNYFTVQNILPNSPASEADVRVGDIIYKIGFFSTRLYSLNGVLNQFQKKPGKKIKFSIKRDGKRIKKVIVLRDLI